VLTRGAKAITGVDPGPESGMREDEIGAGLQEGLIETETNTAIEIVREIREEIGSDMVGETRNGAEVEIDIVARKVCIIRGLHPHPRHAHKVQNVLYLCQTSPAEGHDPAH
jgi:hypothetical protein